MAPRSSATPLSPASASSFPRIPPVQPRPTTTASTSFNFVAIRSLPSAHIGNADGIGGEFPVADPRDILAIDRDGAGKAKKTPARLVAVASVDRVREHSFHDSLIDRAPKDARR